MKILEKFYPWVKKKKKYVLKLPKNIMIIYNNLIRATVYFGEPYKI